MVSGLKDTLLEQIDRVLAYPDILNEKSEYDDMSGLPRSDYEKFVTMALAAINRSAGMDSIYGQQATHVLKSRESTRRTNYTQIVRTLVGTLESLREALVSGYLDEASEIIHASVFVDFLEMSQHLLDQGYKDASAVIAGSSLEAHLRHLCDRYGVEAANNDGQRKKADRINADLTKANAYQLLDQKNITAWLDLRNHAAHGEYDEYTPEMVANLISGVRDFISRTTI